MNAERRHILRLTLLGLLTGLLASGSVLLFRWCVEAGQVWFLPAGQVGNYEGLPAWARLLLPVTGGLLLGLLFDRLPNALRQVGVIHVLAHLREAGTSPLPWRNALVQFFGGIVAIISGHSVDREGPGVHLGAATASSVGRRLGTTSRDDPTLVACGAAAAIAAAFNTPLAGVVFVIEVLRVRYGVTRFIPVVAAAVVGAVISRYLYGPQPAFDVPAVDPGGLEGIPLQVLVGLVAGLLSSGFVFLAERVSFRTADWSSLRAFALAGLVTGVLALWVPQIMGISYDSLDAMLRGQLGLLALVGVVSAKLLATAIAVGLRVPGGLIGPTLVVGGGLGSLAGILAAQWFPGQAGSASFFTVVGMVAMMGAVLRAPLAALIALLELTATPDIILPGMVAVVSADVANRVVLGRDSVFAVLLGERNQEELPSPAPASKPQGSA